MPTLLCRWRARSGHYDYAILTSVKRVLTSLLFVLALSFLSFAQVFAQYSSSNYKAEETFFGTGGELQATSPSYKAQSSVGALGVGKVGVGEPTASVQGNQNFASGSGNSLNSAFSSNVTAGHLLVAAIGGGTVSNTVTDSQGNTYTKAKDGTNPAMGGGGGYYVAIYYAVAKNTGPNTVTVNYPGSITFRRIAIHEYSGVNAIDVTSSNTGTGTTVSSGSATTNHANELIFGWMLSDSGVTSAGSGYTLRETAGSESTMDKTVSSIGSYNVTAPTSSSAWIGLMATFYYNSAYLAYPGFLTPNEPFLEMSINTSTADLGVLDSTAAKTANATFTVRAYTDSGYTVATISQPPKTSTGLTLTPMTALGSSTVGTEQFGMNLVANTSPANFGTNPSKEPDDTFAQGKAAPGYDTQNQYKYNPGDIIAETGDNGWGQTTYTISYIANIGPITKAGQYSMVHDLVAVPTY